MRSFLFLSLYLSVSLGSSNSIFFNPLTAKTSTDNSKSLGYGRIKLITSINYSIHKALIDSVFTYVDASLQKTELRIGYKMTSDIEIVLFKDLNSYQEAYKSSKIYCEQHDLPKEFSTEKVLPLFIAQNFNAIKCDIQFLVTYFLLDEFLHGVGVKQRLNQGDAVRLPIWLIHGYCSAISTPWSAKDADAYLYFSDKGDFKNNHKIPAEAQSTFGKFIWHHILSNSNKNIESTIWFTVKYTNQLNEAFMFQFKQDFDEWLKNLPVISNKIGSSSNDLILPKFFEDKVIQQITISKENTSLMLISDEAFDYLVLSAENKSPKILKTYQSFESINPWFRKREFHLWCDELTHTFKLAQRTGTDILFFEFSDDGEVIKIDSLNLELKDINNGLNLSLFKLLRIHNNDFQQNIEGSLLDVITTDVYNKDTINYCITISSIIKSSPLNLDKPKLTQVYLMSFFRFNKHNWQLLRTDTFNAMPVVGSLMLESFSRISYSWSNNSLWKLNFIEFNDKNDIQWNTGNTIRYFKHTKDYRNRIIETGKQATHSIVSIIDNWQESKQDIINLYKQQESSKENANINLDTITPVIPITGFNYIGNFNPRSWLNKTKQNSVNQYLGIYNISPITPSYYLKHAGVYLSNFENRNFTYLNKIPLNNLVNSPFTPIIRLHLSDKLNTHNLKLMLFSNIVGSRNGMELDQRIKISNNSILTHSIWWRNRNYLNAENNLIRNSTVNNKIGISQYWFNNLFSTIESNVRYDAFYPRVSNLSQSFTPSTRSLIVNLQLSINLYSTKAIASSLKHWNYSIAASVGHTYFYTENQGNVELKIEGITKKSMGKHVQYRNRYCGIYSFGAGQTLYLLGGSDGWVDNQQYINRIPAIKSESNFLALGFGLPIRGFLYGNRVGSSLIGIQQQIEIELFKSLINRQIRNIFINDLVVFSFFDAGLAFVDKSPKELSNPYHTRQINSSNYQLWYSSLHSPWIYSLGIGLRTYILGFPLKYEFSMPFMDRKMLKTQHLIGLQWEF